ncbi:MAG: iron-sulfur cluster co-chaperone HscB C-terminal domain-containing protein [Chitinophagaceae bacterium]
MKNYFLLLDIAENIKIDPVILDNKFYPLIKKNHPDFTRNLSDEEKEEALLITADLNDAKNIFSDEHKTLLYLLQLKNIITPNEKYILDNLFLLDILELNEQFDIAISEHNFIEIQSIKQSVEQKQQELYNKVSPIILHYDESTITTEDLEKLKAYHYKKQYLQKIVEKIK